jgi:hypothetical protein
MGNFNVSEPDEYLGDKAEAVANAVVEFVFEKLPAITIFAAILYLIWNLLDPVIVF